VNYRANLWALRECAPTGIVAVAAVGSIRSDLRPGDLVIPHQIIDYTWARPRPSTKGRTVRSRMSTSPSPMIAFCAGGSRRGGSDRPGSVRQAVYAATQGPRLETAAEINRLERDGADVVGMTGMPEAVLARELAIPYAAINVVANYAAGRGDSREVIRMDAILAVLEGAMQQVLAIIERMLTNHD
jgi:purine nucleoside phosphorylase